MDSVRICLHAMVYTNVCPRLLRSSLDGKDPVILCPATPVSRTESNALLIIGLSRDGSVAGPATNTVGGRIIKLEQGTGQFPQPADNPVSGPNLRITHTISERPGQKFHTRIEKIASRQSIPVNTETRAVSKSATMKNCPSGSRTSGMVHLPVPVNPKLDPARTIELEQNDHSGRVAPIINPIPTRQESHGSENAGAKIPQNSYGNHGVMSIPPSNGHGVAAEYPPVLEPMFRRNAYVNTTNRLIADRMPYVNPRLAVKCEADNMSDALSQFAHHGPSIPNYPLPVPTSLEPLQSVVSPADFPQRISFYISAPFLQLPCGSIFVSGLATPENRLVQLRGHVRLNYFIGHVRHAQSITPDLRARTLLVVVGARSFDIDLLDSTRCEMEWTMVLGLLLLGEEHVAWVSVGVQVMNAGAGMLGVLR